MNEARLRRERPARRRDECRDMKAGERAVASLSQALVEAGALIMALTPQTVTLEDLFFSFTEGDENGPTPAAPAPAQADEVRA